MTISLNLIDYLLLIKYSKPFYPWNPFHLLRLLSSPQLFRYFKRNSSAQIRMIQILVDLNFHSLRKNAVSSLTLINSSSTLFFFARISLLLAFSSLCFRSSESSSFCTRFFACKGSIISAKDQRSTYSFLSRFAHRHRLTLPDEFRFIVRLKTSNNHY